MKVELIGEDDAGRWQAFVATRPDASLYHDYRWRGVIERAFDRETFYLAAMDEAGQIVGVLPLAHLKSPVFGDFLVSLPYFNYGGLLAESPDVRAALRRAAEELASALGVDHIEYRHVTDIWPEATQRTDKVAMLLQLPSDTATLDKSLGSKLRAQIKRPLKEGATVDHGGLEHIDDFYRVFAHNMRDLGTPVYGKRFFKEIAEAFTAETRVFVVRLGGAAVAAGLVLRHRERAEIPWAASLRDANRIGVNMLLYGRILEWCVEQGVRTFDFGRSTVDAGTYRFKRQWGAEPLQLHWHYWLPSGRALPQIRPDNPKYQLMVRLWQRLPVAVATALGPHIVKNIP
jgi:FemAB-related protein (PEP-CTERM system-associated)